MGWVVWIGGEKEESELSEERNRVYTTVLYNDHKKIGILASIYINRDCFLA